MKRIASAVLVLVAVTSVSPMAFSQVSVPNLVNFQGRLTDTSGVPVPDGAYGVTFRLYTAPSGGSLAWAETSLVTTSNGVFTHQLGSANTFSSTFFQNYDSLFLEIVVGGETITPRSRLTSSPYSRLSNGLEVWDDVTNDTMVITTIPSSSRISTYGNGGAERFRLHGNNWAQLLMYDNNPSSDLTVALHANFNAGGQLDLNQEDGSAGAVLRGGSTANGATLSMYSAAGSATISLDADLTGTGAAVLPADAISDLEIDDEPGVASDTAYTSTGLVLSGANQNIGVRTITVPTSGYVLAIGTCNVLVSHTNGSSSVGNFGVSDVSVSFPPNQDGDVVLPSALPTGTYQWPVTMHGLFSVSSGSHTFYFVSDEDFGSWTVYDEQFTLIFFPTAYGTVEPTLVSGESDLSDQQAPVTSSLVSAQDIAAEQAEAASFNSARLEKELAEIKAQRADLEARISKLEKEIDRENPDQGVE